MILQNRSFFIEVGRGGLAPQILVGVFFKGLPKKKIFLVKKGNRREVQNSSADEKKVGR
jgi:hypothetical protein